MRNPAGNTVEVNCPNVTPEQIVCKLREADRLLNEGADVAAVARHLEVSEQTYHRWRA